MNYTDSITTQRLVTRKLKQDDYKEWMAFFLDENSIRFIPDPGEKDPENRAIHWIEWQLKRYRENRLGLHALIDRHSGAFIGQCGLLLQKIDGTSEIEIGYHILPQYRKQGFASEAAQAFKSYAFEVLDLPSVISMINIANISSQRVAEKNGMVRERQLKIGDEDLYIYRSVNRKQITVN